MEETKPGTVGFRLSPQQEHLLGRAGPAAVTRCAVLLSDAADEAALRAALESAIARHEILRTTFVRPAGMRVPQQVIHDELPLSFTAGDEAGLDAALARDAEAELDLEAGPVVLARLAALPDGGRALVLTVPAACADAGSLLVLLDELSRSQGADSPGDEPLQYADYAEWRRELLAGDDAEAEQGRAHWSGGDTAPPAPKLLFGTPERAGGRSPDRVPIALGPEETAALRRAADESRASEAQFLEACWHALVGRLSGRAELVLAGVESGRSQAELVGAVGAYAQAVAVRSRYEQETSFAEIIDQVRRARAEGARWQDYAAASDLSTVAGRAGIGFSYTGAGPDVGLGEVVALLPDPAGLSLQLGFHARADSLHGELVYDPDAYGRSDAEEIASRFRTLLASAAADPAQPVARLELLEPGERERLVAAAAGPRIEAPTAPFHHAFEEQAARTPARAAVMSASGGSTYAELNEDANRLAHELRELGVGRDTPVGLCMDRSPAMLTALLAILKAGGAYLPLNFEHPPARVSHQLAEAGAVALVTQEPLLDRLPQFAGPVVCTDRDADRIAARPATDPAHVSEPDDLVYVMYTSGSTGLPKGVAVSHRNLANYVASLIERLEADEADDLQYAVISAISTDLGNTAIFPALASGGCVHLISPEAAMDADAFSAYAAAHPLDVLKITPSHLGALLAGGAGVLPRRRLVVGGEALSWELVERIQAYGTGTRILNHYGPTETTIGSCTLDVDRGAPAAGAAAVPIGRPIANTFAYVLDGRLEPVPDGVAGELCIAGAGVARGYVNRPDETAERFVADPCSSEPGARMYRTGDRARRLRDGSIEFLGRVDQQVKIRGFRVEPGEIEAALARHPSVRQVAVAARDGEHGDPRLVAYVVASPEPGAGELQAFLAESLPDYMVPSLFATLDSLPLTPSGKVDRQALPDPASLQTQREASYVAPRDEIEEEIAGIWAELLGLDRVGADDDFFALGGHSLLATQAIIRIRRAHGDIPLHALLAAPTVAALAEVVRSTTASGTPDLAS